MNRSILAILAISITALCSPAEARHRAPAKIASTPIRDVAAVPAYPSGADTGRPDHHVIAHERKGVRTARYSREATDASQRGYGEVFTYLPHPAGCPARLFCACGAAVEIFGRPIRALWPVSEWRRRFARAAPAPGNVAIERSRSHLFVLVSHVGGDDWLVSDFNSGGHQSRRHVRSIAGTIIVDPHSDARRYSSLR